MKAALIFRIKQNRKSYLRFKKCLIELIWTRGNFFSLHICAYTFNKDDDVDVWVGIYVRIDELYVHHMVTYCRLMRWTPLHG